MESRKEPALHLRFIPHLVTFGRPNVKGFLRQVARITFLACQTARKAIKIRIVQVHQFLELRLLTHSLSYYTLGGTGNAFGSKEFEKNDASCRATRISMENWQGKRI